MRVQVKKMTRPPSTRIEGRDQIRRDAAGPTDPFHIENTRPFRRDETHPVRRTMTGDLLDGRGRPVKSLKEALHPGWPMILQLEAGDRLTTTPIQRVIIEDDDRLAIIHTASSTIYEIFSFQAPHRGD